MSLAYRDATAGDAAALSHFATAKFIEAYRDQAAVDVLTEYAQHNFTAEKTLEEIESRAARFFLVEDESGLAAYALLRYDSFPDCRIDAARPAQLQRIYVDPRWQGGGVARELLGRCTADACAAGCDVVWLAVWVQNARAIRFYLKSGFAVIGEQGFILGDEVQRDFVMAWPAS